MTMLGLEQQLRSSQRPANKRRSEQERSSGSMRESSIKTVRGRTQIVVRGAAMGMAPGESSGGEEGNGEQQEEERSVTVSTPCL